MIVTRRDAEARDAQVVLELFQQLERSAEVFLRRFDRRKSHCEEKVGQVALSDKEDTEAGWGNLPGHRGAGSLRRMP